MSSALVGVRGFDSYAGLGGERSDAPELSAFRQPASERGSRGADSGPLTIYPRSTSTLGALAAYLLRARTAVERDQAYPTPSAMAHDGPLLTQQPAQPLTPTTAQRNGAMGRRSRASGFDSPGGHLGHMDVRGGMNRVAGCPVTGGRPGTPPGNAAVRHPDRCIREVKGLPRGEEKPRIEFESRLAHSGGVLPP